MPSNLRKTSTFGELIRSGALQIGDGYRAKNEELGGDGPIFLRAGHVTDTTIDFTGVERFHSHLTDRVAGKMAQPGDAVVTTKGNSTGRVTYIGEGLPPFVYSPHLSYWRSCDHNQLVPRFLYYWSRTDEFKTQLRGMSASTDMAPYLSLSDQRRLRITLPRVEHQRTVSDILGVLDDKIELNRRMNETLEAMANALFKSWFVDFDPVRAKAEGRKPAGMDADTAALFSDTLVESALGKVPKGWQVAPLGEHIEAVKGLSYKGSGLSETGLPLHNLNSVYEGGGYKYEGIKYYEGDYRERHILHPGDVIVANTEQGHDLLLIGYPAIVPKQFGSMGLFSHHIYRVRPLPKSPLTPHFVYLLLMTQRFRDEVTGYTNGTTVNMLSVDGLQRPLLVVPPSEVMGKFEEVVTPLFQKAEQIHDESPVLAAIRDTLLPKLLSGELRVKEASQQMEAAT